MGVIRGFFLTVVASLLFLSLFCSVLLLAVSSSLKYENVEKEATGILKEVTTQNMNLGSVMDTAYPFFQEYCKIHSSYIVRTEQGYNITLSCSAASESKEALTDELVKGVVHEIYYTQYDCDFISCFKQQNETPLFLISEKACNFWRSAFYISLLACFILIIGTFFLIKNKTNLPILAGSLMIASSLPFFGISSLINFISDKTVAKVASAFLSRTKTASLIFLIIGIAFVVLGIVLKIFKIGFSISEIASKFKGKTKGKAKPASKAGKKKKSKHFFFN
jgi:hypothetical protein